MANMTGLDTNSINSLFGDYLQDPRLAAEQKRAYEVAQLDPMQQLTYQARSNAPAAGRQLAGLFGVQDPVMKEQSIARQVRQEMQSLGLQPNQQEYWDKTVQRLGELGASRAQAEASSIGLKLKEQLANIGQKTGENMNTLIASGKFTPESLGVYAKTRNPADLREVDKPEMLDTSSKKEIGKAVGLNKTLESTNTVLDKFIDDISNDKVQVGIGKLTKSGWQNLTGKQDENTLALDSLTKFIERERNNILMAAKGTQTEGDAQRALNQIIGPTNWTSKQSMLNALNGLKEYKQTQIDSNNAMIESLQGSRKISKQPPVAPSTTTNQPTKQGKVNYALIRSKPGWGNATDKQIDDAIASGKIKLGQRQ